ncbi:MAG TPA: Ig-like domain-containing protein, partial [Bacteroidia bacterium]|nr:Ig-like domain-containing protein [Bacteroidia bacterium]
MSLVVTNKTLLGLPGARLRNLNQTKDGSGILNIKGGSNNVIIRNLIFEGPGAYDTDGRDLLTLEDASEIWVDHCEFQDGMDGNFDHKGLTDNTTVSWTKFTYLKAPKPDGSGGTDDHRFSNLVGSDDDDKPSDGKYSITWQYCWWAQGCVERMTRARNAQLNMVSCYWNSSVAKVALGLGYSDCYVENSVFANSGDKYRNYGGTVRLTSVGCTAPPANVGTCPAPGYTRESIPASSVVSTLTGACGAGATLNVTSSGAVSAKSSCGGTPVNEFPTVSITSPADNATFTAPASVTINATAADADGSVTKVDFYNGNTLIGTDESSSYSFTWTNVAAGTYTITAKATDNSGAVTTSSDITIVVNPSGQSPTVSITSPANNATFTAPASITLDATAADADGSVTKVDFYNGGTLLGTDASAPYSFPWTNVAAGTYTITAKATDNSGAVTTSSPITVVVNGIPGSDVTIQAETACEIVGILETKNAGFNGASYVNVDNEVGTTIAWSVNSQVNQTVSLTLRYAATTDRNMSLTVNGTMQVPVVSLPSTGAFTTWNTSTVQITLVAGTNRIVATSLVSDGGPNIDELTFNSNNISTGSCSEAPTVSITSPANNASFTAPASVTINATAADADGNIAKVDFYNGTTFLGTDASSPYSFTWANVAAGTYSITAIATDNSGAITTSSSISITVNPPQNLNPVVNVTGPTTTSWCQGTAITLTATASDQDGTISKVEFYDGTTLLSTVTTLPYTFNWTNAGIGTHSITAKATDNQSAV